MAIFRVEKTRDYTVMSNQHLKNKALSLKAKGLLSLMLSLPDDWDFTMRGLAAISLEGIDAIRQAVGELERQGYVHRLRVRDTRGCLKGSEYVIYEQPKMNTPSQKNPIPKAGDPPAPDKPALGSPALGKPISVCAKTRKSAAHIVKWKQER
jgi:hypothetical protein